MQTGPALNAFLVKPHLRSALAARVSAALIAVGALIQFVILLGKAGEVPAVFPIAARPRWLSNRRIWIPATTIVALGFLPTVLDPFFGTGVISVLRVAARPLIALMLFVYFLVPVVVIVYGVRLLIANYRAAGSACAGALDRGWFYGCIRHPAHHGRAGRFRFDARPITSDCLCVGRHARFCAANPRVVHHRRSLL